MADVYGFLWLDPAVWSRTMLPEPQSIWQISVLTDGAPSIQQSICFILIPSNVYSRIWPQSASLPRLQRLLSSISAFLLLHLLRLFSLPLGMTFWPSAQKQHSPLTPKSDTLPIPQVGQPNRAIRQDIHHYPVGWSKWPWCSLHTQFQIPLGSIMGRFKQRGARPAFTFDSYDTRCDKCVMQRGEKGRYKGGGMRWRGWVSRWGKLRWSKRAPGDEKRRWLEVAGRASR